MQADYSIWVYCDKNWFSFWGASEGIGARIADARAMLETSAVMAYVVLVIAFVALFDYLIIKPLEILFIPWRR